MPQIGRFTHTVASSITGHPVSGATLTIYREGATVNGAQSGVSPLAVTVRHIGKLKDSDTVFINTTTGTTYTAAVTESTGVTVTLSGFGGTLNLADGDRIIPSNNAPTFYNDDQGGTAHTPTANVLTSSSVGLFSSHIEYGAYDYIVSGGSLTATLFYGIVAPTESPARIAFADSYTANSSTGGIQEAIDSLYATGGTVKLSGGKTYSISAQMNVPSKITLEGCGMGSTIVQVAASGASAIIPIQNADTTNGNSFICFKDFTLDCNQANQTGGGDPVAIHMNKVSQLRLDGVEIKNTIASGLYVQGSTAQKHIRVTDCYIHDTNIKTTTNGHAGVNIVSTSAAMSQVIIRDNWFENNGLGNATPLSIADIRTIGASGNADETIVSGNTIVTSKSNGMYLATNGRIVVDHNYLKDCGQQNSADGGNCIFVDIVGTGEVTVTNNVCDGVPALSDNGIEISGGVTDTQFVISNNRIRNILNANKYGIGIGGVGSVVVSGNNISTINGVGIQNSSDGPTASRSITLTGNVCHECLLGGINIRGKFRVTIVGNDCSSSGQGLGIQVAEGTTTSGAEASDLTISGNTCWNNQGATTGYGIGVFGDFIAPAGQLARRISITGNVCYQNTLDGILLGGVIDCTVTGNVLVSNLRDGIRIDTSISDAVIDSNVIKSNGGYGLNINGITPTRLMIGQSNVFQNNTTAAATTDAGMPILTGATPSVAGVWTARLNDNTAITDFTGGYDGQIINLVGQHATGPAIADAGAFVMMGAHTVSAGDVLTLIRRNGVWHELAYANNA